jgi:hypothetical protein
MSSDYSPSCLTRLRWQLELWFLHLRCHSLRLVGANPYRKHWVKQFGVHLFYTLTHQPEKKWITKVRCHQSV